MTNGGLLIWNLRYFARRQRLLGQATSDPLPPETTAHPPHRPRQSNLPVPNKALRCAGLDLATVLLLALLKDRNGEGNSSTNGLFP
ncbi:MAG: hypothetical protein ACRDTJ_33050 [Pseudonocardiaceae bacterium]